MPANNKKRYNSVAIILLCSIVVLFIMEPWQLFFLNDDFEHIPMSADNLLIRKNFIRPIANLFLFFDRAIYNKWAPGFFLTTWILHTGCALGIYYLCKEIIIKYNIGLPIQTALITSVLFIFYPFHAEPLFWIIGRGAIIAALFTILSVFFFLRKRENKFYFILSAILFILSLFTYESTWNVMLFYGVITHLGIKELNANKREEYARQGILIGIFVLYFVTRILTLDSFYGNYEEISQNIYNVPLLIINLVKLVGRNFIPPLKSETTSIIVFIVSLCVYGVAIIKAFKTSKTVGYLMTLLIFGIISGVATAAPLGISTHTNESERYIYYSSFFFCFFLSAAISFIRANRLKLVVTAALVAASIMALRIYQEHYQYSSSITRQSLEFIKKYKGYKNASFVNVPGEYKGALIFRVCLPEAIRWIAPESHFKSIIEVSKTVEASGILFKTGEKTLKEFMTDTILHTTEVQKKARVIDSLNITKDDAVFWFTDSGLFKINTQ